MFVFAQITPRWPAGSDPIRICSAADRRAQTWDGKRWAAAIADPGSVVVELFNGDFGSEISVGIPALSIATREMERVYPAAKSVRWESADVQIWAGDFTSASGTATFPYPNTITALCAGQVTKFEKEGDLIKLRIDPQDKASKAKVLSLEYAGTGGAEGGLDKKGTLKPWVFGYAQNVEPVLIDEDNSVYQFSGYGPIQAVSALYERGSDFGASVGNYASYSALAAAAIPEGRWATCLASGMVRLGAPQAGVITGDVQGHLHSGVCVRKTGAIINAFAGLRGVAVDSSSLSALDAFADTLPGGGNVNLVLREQIDVLSLARRLCAPLNAQAGIALAGTLFACRTVIGSPSFVLDARGRRLPLASGFAEGDTPPPFKRIVMGAARSWRVHDIGSEIAFFAQIKPRGRYDAAETYREGDMVDLADGSTWLYTNPVATSGNAPVTGSTYWFNLSPALDAEGIKYTDGTPIEDLQPAEPGATLGAVVPGLGTGQPTNIRNHAGVTVRVDELLNSAISLAPTGALSIIREGGAPTPLGRVRVAELGAASAASMRAADDALDQLAAAVMEAAITARDIRTTMRDATIYTDPATGRVGISAVDQVAGDVKAAAITLDAVKSELTLRATRTYVDDQIALAVLDPSQVPVFTALEARITTAEVRLNGVDAALVLKADAVTLSALTATVTTVETELDALAGVVATKVSSSNFDTLATRVTVAEETLEAIGDTAAITRAVSVARLVAREQEDLAATTLAGLVDAEAARRRDVAAAASAREEINALVNERDGAQAAARLRLEADLAANRAAAEQELSVLSSDLEAEAAARRALEVELGAAKADVVDESVARIAGDAAEAAARQALAAELTSDIGEVAASVTSEAGARTTADAALANQIDAVEAALTSDIGDVAASVTDEVTARVAGDAANAAAIASVSTTVDGHTATLATQAESINGIRARYTLRLDVGERVTGMVWDANSTTTTVDFIADAFRLWVPTLGVARQIFAATDDGIEMTGNVQINGDLIVTGTVGAARLPLSDKSFEVNGADLVEIKQLTVAPPAGVTVFCDHVGVPKSGQLPKVLTPVVTRGGVDIRTSNDATYAISAPGAVAASVNNTGGSADKGRITIGTGWAGPGTISLTVTVDGVAYGPYPIAVARQNDPPPTTGGGGGGGVKSGSDSTFAAVSTTAFAAISDEITVDVASGESIRVTAPLDYTVSAINTIAGRALVAKAQYQESGGAWTDFPSSPVTGSDASWSANDFSGEPGSIALDQTQGGLATGAVTVRLVAALSGSSGNPTINIQSGTMNVSVA